MNYNPIRSRIENFEAYPFDYRTREPHPALRKYVHSYWSLSGHLDPSVSAEIQCIPHGGFSLMFNLSMSPYVYLSGIASAPIFDRIHQSPDLFGVHFYPGQIKRFFNLPLDELYDKPFRFNRLVNQSFSFFEEELMLQTSFEDRVKLIETYLLKRLASGTHPMHASVEESLWRIQMSHGNIHVKELAEGSQISSRYLQNLFKNDLGISPKAFAKIIRFQSILRELLKNGPTPLLHKAMDYGYYDQSHFIKDFKQFYGSNPTQATKLW